MKISNYSAALLTDKLNEMTEFYTGLIGLEIEMDFGPCKILKDGPALWQVDSEHPVAEYLKVNQKLHPNRGVSLGFETDDFASDCKKVIDSGVKLMHGERTETWGQKTIRFFDPDNNMVELGESIPCFVRRLSTEGLSPEEVADKTSVSLDAVLEMLRQ